MKQCKHSSRIFILLALITLPLISGCVGSGLRNIMTEEKEYKVLINEIPDMQQSYGRIFIYSPKGGPSYPLNSMGDIDFFSIDKNIYRFGGESYFYLDIESGSHILTVTNVVVRGFASNKKQVGDNKLEINLSNQQVIYLRLVNLSKSKSIDERIYRLEEVEINKAEKEMASLSFWNNHETTMKIK